MRIHNGLAASVQSLTRGAIAIGNFDGVHLGHQALFAAARRDAAGGPVCALIFEPHPARLLAPQYAPPLICELPRKRELIAGCGVSDLVEQRFDARFAATDPTRFVEMLLATSVAEVVVGHDFTYGKGREGTVDSLRVALEERGVKLHLVAPVAVNGLVCSSTKVREFVLEGRVEAGNMLLGRPFDLDGEVVQGAGRGRKLGWPTANIRTSNELLPAVGVYAVRARLLPDGAPIPGAANLGLNPTFRPEMALAGAAGRPPLSLEVHLFDFGQDIYGRRVRVEFVHRLREERRFPGVEALKAQIAQDVTQARRLLGL
ncbi:MAG TPA: riboflavin biosynthesis protein RibF [Myxococcales bacterium]|jgi:riboflavin kinase/FMN adenylyltransferase|nr:riboflavin biosynthesis protein RibF [Myxococcales bacterium]